MPKAHPKYFRNVPNPACDHTKSVPPTAKMHVHISAAMKNNAADDET